jgi:hypothetical protein
MQIKAGQVVHLGDSLILKVSKLATSPFTGVAVKGEPIAVAIELDAGNKAVTVSYRASANLGSSELYLTSGASRLAPRAVIEDFPSWGTDNDKEIEVLDPKETGGTSVEFEGKGSISLLFDAPSPQAKSPKKLSITLRVVGPKEERHSLVVTI